MNASAHASESFIVVVGMGLVGLSGADDVILEGKILNDLRFPIYQFRQGF